MQEQKNKCIICLNTCCDEDSVHIRTTIDEFTCLLNSVISKNCNLSALLKIKYKVSIAFQKIALSGKINPDVLKQYCNRVYLLLDKINFWFLIYYPNQPFKILEKVFFNLPVTKYQMNILIQSLMIENQYNKPSFNQYKKIFFQVHKFKKSKNFIASNQQYHRLYDQLNIILREMEKQVINTIQDSQKRISYNRIETSQFQQITQQFVVIQGLPFSTTRKSINLSMSQLNTKILLTYLPALQKMRHVQELEIRQNQLCNQGYRMLFNAMPRLRYLDLRGCNLNNGEINVLCEKMKNLHVLYLSQTLISDNQLIQISQHLKDLNFLYIDDNRLSIETISIALTNMLHLKYLSVRRLIDENNNNLQQQLRIMNEILLNRQGYLQY